MDNFQPVGTCFAISPKYLLTAQHNMNELKKEGYAIAESTSRLNSGATHLPTGYRKVEVIYYNQKMDYAILKDLSESNDLQPIPISIRDVEDDTDLKVFHCPVGLFNDMEFGDLTVFTAWVKCAKPMAHHITCTGGLFAGSSGAPFVTREGYAVGLHVESINSAKIISVDEVSSFSADTQSAIEIISETVNSSSNSHASLSRALYLGKCKKLIETIEIELGIQIHR